MTFQFAIFAVFSTLDTALMFPNVRKGRRIKLSLEKLIGIIEIVKEPLKKKKKKSPVQTRRVLQAKAE